LIANADQKLKAKFYYLKGKALYQNGTMGADIKKVGEAFNQLIDYEKGINSFKYTAEVGDLLNKMVADVAAEASKDYDVADQSKLPEDYMKSAKGFHTVYVLSPTDTSFLDNAALLYNFGKDYETSKELYEKLLDLGYTGISTSYIATNKTDGQEVTYSDKKSRDLQVKLGIAENPREETRDSRREVMFKNLAQNYVSLEDSDKALEIITLGREEFPNSYALLIDEANIYYNSGDNMKFKEKLEEAINLNPSEPSLYYNVGVMNMEQKNTDEAINNFKKAIELKPDYADAYNNIGAAIIEKANAIIEEMNNNLSNFEKYDALQAQQMEIYKEAIPYYESAYKFNNSNFSVVQTLMGLYENLEMTDKYNEIKAVYDSLKE
jgi:tetratricopeptide (TPR) repeat protein